LVSMDTQSISWNVQQLQRPIIINISVPKYISFVITNFATFIL
jgi:hypothetical protein